MVVIRCMLAALAVMMASAIAAPAIALDNKKLADPIAIGERLTRDGRVALYGIFFESDKANVRPESDDVIGAIGELLANNPDLEIAVIGHTDATGPHEHNLDLSKMRANAVVNALVNRHGIERARLYPAGAGFLQPVADNRTDVGRALNRRVELVRMAAIKGEDAPNTAPMNADEAEAIAENARNIVKAMSDYLAANNAIQFNYNAILEVVTTDDQKLSLASSGELMMEREGKLYLTRHGGFANVEVVYDGETLTLVGKNRNAYAQAPMSGTIDELIETLRTDFGRQVPGADLLLSNVYDELMPQVTDIKDLGSGVVNGQECDHLAFRTDDVDWQIWIAQGNVPHPCRYTITTRNMKGQPQYTIELSNWDAGAQIITDRFVAILPQGGMRVNGDDLEGSNALPAHMRQSN